MKHLIILVLLFVLYCDIAEAQSPTFANIAGPENVLVVYNTRLDTSRYIKDYYVNARNIPSVNVVGLDIITDTTTIIYQGVPHLIQIQGWGDIIRDTENDSLVPTFHSWKYFLDSIATPIKNHLVTNNLEEKIRYIVLCKGIPFKICASYNSAGVFYEARGNLPIDGLLCMLNTSNYDSLIENTVYPDGIETNPYYGKDPNYTMDYRFLPDHFTTANHNLSYLVSHIDGVYYQNVKDIIDRSVDADKSGTGIWILDDDLCFPGYVSGHLLFTHARQKLASFGFNVAHDSTDTWTTHNTYQVGPVMGYSSWGTHAEDGNCDWNDSAYVADSLQFQYANGSVFNTIESFNGTSLTTLYWRGVGTIPPDCHHTQGLMTQFPMVGGTAGVAHAWEPGVQKIIDFDKYYTSYAMGYSVVDAAYLGMDYLAWQNVVVGDPLTTIAWGKQTTTQNLDMKSTNLVTDTIHISSGDTLTFTNGSAIILKHHGFVVSNESSVLVLGNNVTLSSDSWDRGLLLADSCDYPQLIWTINPYMSPINYYKIYRKFDSSSWTVVDSTTENTWSDLSLTFRKGNGVYYDSVYYYVVSFNSVSTSDPSNTVSAKLGIIIENEIAEGWQILSVPVVVDDYSADSVFPTHTGNIYGYDGGYIEVDTLENGPGYWIDFDSSQTKYHSGLAIDTISIAVPSGWSFLGSISYNVMAGDICTEPSGIISAIYSYDNGYVLLGDSSLIEPGIGYWLNADSSGTVFLSEYCGMQKITASPEINLAVLDKFIVTDSYGKQQSIYVANIDIDTALVDFDRSMPPPMPVLGFDARFNYGEFIKAVSVDSGVVDLEIDVESDAYPITLSWELNPENGIEYSFISDSGLGKISQIKVENGQAKFSENSRGSIQLFGKVNESFKLIQIPDKFELIQNYPNPFNPTTTIKYSLPKDGLVSLTVYNAIGERVVELMNGEIKAGYYEVIFDASRLSSGVYFYQIVAGKYMDAKKMILLK